MLCPNCGADILNENAKRCQQCGAPVRTQGSQAEDTPRLFQPRSFFFADESGVEKQVQSPEPAAEEAVESPVEDAVEPIAGEAAEPSAEAAAAPTGWWTAEEASDLPPEEVAEPVAEETADLPVEGAVEPAAEAAFGLPAEEAAEPAAAAEIAETSEIAAPEDSSAQIDAGNLEQPPAAESSESVEGIEPAIAGDEGQLGAQSEAQPDEAGGLSESKPEVKGRTIQIEQERGGHKGVIIALIVAAVVVLGIVAFVVLRPFGPGTVDKSGFVGDWELVEGNTEGLQAENLETLRSIGQYVVLSLNEDETGTFALFDDKSQVTWKAKTSTEGTLVFKGSSLNIALSDESLVATSGGGDEMKFKRHVATETPEPSVPFASSGSSATSAASAASSSASSSPGSSAAQASSSATQASASSSSSGAAGAVQNGMQTVGNAACGFMQVPASWESRIADYDRSMVEATDMVYYCDPDSEYLSSTFEHFMFARAVQMRCYPTLYYDIADQVMASYDPNQYSNISYEETTFNGHNCVVISAVLGDDNLSIYNIAIDRDDDNRTTVLLTLQGTPDTVETVREYASNWSMTE